MAATPEENMEHPVRLIKKYPNRRLYDTKTSSYITLADVKQMVVKNEEFQVRRREVQRGPVAPDPAADHPRRGIRRHADVLLRPAVADDPLLRQRDAGLHGLVPREEPRGLPADAEGAAGAVAEALRRQLEELAGDLGAVHEHAGPGDAGPDAGLHGAEPEDVRAVPGADAEPGAQHVHRLPVPGISRRKAAPTKSLESQARERP